MKRYSLSQVSFTALLAVILLAPSQSIGAIVNRNDVHIRSQGSTESESKDKVGRGDKVIILEIGKKESIGKWGTHYWYRVTYSPSFDTFFDGWIFGAFITSTISGNNVRLRSKPATKGSEILDSLKIHTKVVVINTYYDTSDRSGIKFPRWYCVKTPSGNTGWVHTDYLK